MNTKLVWVRTNVKQQVLHVQILYIHAWTTHIQKTTFTHWINAVWGVFILYKPAHLHHTVLRSSQDVYERFGVVAVIVLPNIGDCGEG